MIHGESTLPLQFRLQCALIHLARSSNGELMNHPVLLCSGTKAPSCLDREYRDDRAERRDSRKRMVLECFIYMLGNAIKCESKFEEARKQLHGEYKSDIKYSQRTNAESAISCEFNLQNMRITQTFHLYNNTMRVRNIVKVKFCEISLLS